MTSPKCITIGFLVLVSLSFCSAHRLLLEMKEYKMANDIQTSTGLISTERDLDCGECNEPVPAPPPRSEPPLPCQPAYDCPVDNPVPPVQPPTGIPPPVQPPSSCPDTEPMPQPPTCGDDSCPVDAPVPQPPGGEPVTAPPAPEPVPLPSVQPPSSCPDTEPMPQPPACGDSCPGDAPVPQPPGGEPVTTPPAPEPVPLASEPAAPPPTCNDCGCNPHLGFCNEPVITDSMDATAREVTAQEDHKDTMEHVVPIRLSTPNPKKAMVRH